MMVSIMLTTLVVMNMPLILSTYPNYNMQNFPTHVKSAVKTAFTLSLIPTIIFIMLDQEMVTFNWHWMTIQSTKIFMSFKLDYFSILFLPTALFVTWSILEFSLWYMASDPNINKFFKYLLMFLTTMLILTTANNLFQLFIGWEGVGIMSFLLIGWWHGRTDANTAALQAMLYNRIGDIGFILMMVWLMLNCNSLDIQQIFMTKINSNIPLMGLLLAAAGKSAQFGLHPWLPAAMEGPTPVSALLHSSTMVVAGIFLMIRFHPMLSNNHTILTMTMCLGAMTTLFTAMCALTQNDIKKIIAFSTSSQLGLMMVTIGINQPYMAFLHICTHAFFKAMLFMCSGSIIHNMKDEQDIRKMGAIYKTLPLTSTALIIGNMALTGIPFLSGFYSKDLIIEAINTSYTNAWALTMTMMATSMTAVYSTRMIIMVLLNNPRYNSMLTMNENNINLNNSIKRLMIGSIFAGFMLTHYITPMYVPPMTMPLFMKMMALIITLTGFIVALDLSMMTHHLKMMHNTHSFMFSNMLGYFTNILHRQPPTLTLKYSQNSSNLLLDQSWYEYNLPMMLMNFHKQMSKYMSNQNGLIKLYFMSFFISMLIMLIFTFSFHE
uniref:NADH-ubiquinone oxidoreductase chain 5 n=1 Tax=Hemiechinus auritus TaxID=217708 RepID=Q7Y8F8_HEMAU|nr:NADH dehydrogenase subunit 5 [Hemiechinus auritus]BAC78858.1 NADH dehydrogenase subunit 5 [Hemiechinus auritus]